MVTARTLIQQALLYAVYFAPRGGERLMILGEQLAQRHLSFSDKLIGIVGDAGSGKSSLIKGMFPGLELANHDDGLDSRKILQVRNTLDNEYDSTTYHIDMRFQLAFTQMYEVVDFVKGALHRGRRVIVEHFDLLYPHLSINAEIIIGIGEEIIVTRPTVFGPKPQDIFDIVFYSLRNRKMAHTAEDLTTLVLNTDYKLPYITLSNDVRNGFVLEFVEKPDIDLYRLEEKVQALIDEGLDVSYYDDTHIQIGDEILTCTGPRLHLRNTGDVMNFNIIKEIKYDYINNLYSLVGTVGDRVVEDDNLNKIMREETNDIY